MHSAKSVTWSNEIKRAVVEKDPTEKGDRMLLNFGHTLGHAIEKLKNFDFCTVNAWHSARWQR